MATVAILAGLGYVLWRGRDQIGPMLARLPDHLPDRFAHLPQLPAPDDVREGVTASWRAALSRLPKLDPEKLGDVSRGFDALKQLFARA